MRQAVEARRCGSCCACSGSMHLLRALSHGLQAAAHNPGMQGLCAAASCRHQLHVQLPRLAHPAAAAGRSAARQNRPIVSAEAARNPAAAAAAAAPLEPAAPAEQPEASNTQDGTSQQQQEPPGSTSSDGIEGGNSSSTGSTADSSGGVIRTVHEPVTALTSLPSSSSSGRSSSSSSVSQGMGHGIPRKLRNAPRRPPLETTRSTLQAMIAPAPTAPSMLTRTAQDGSSNSSSSGGSAFGSTLSNSSSSSGYTGPGHLGYLLGKTHSDKIKARGLQGLSDVQVLPQQLLQDWEAARAALPAAMQRLSAVSRDPEGPVLTVCFDLETCRGTEIVELGAMTADSKPFTDTLIRPLGLVDPETTEIHGLTWQQLQHMPPLPVVLLKFVEWLTKQCQATPGGSCRLVLTGHNIHNFDLARLQHWFEVLHLPALDTMYCHTLDTLELGRDYKKTTKLVAGAGLQDLAQHFGCKGGGSGAPAHMQAHRGLGDVDTNLRVLKELAAWALKLQPAEAAQLSVADAVARLLHEQPQRFRGQKLQQQPQQQQKKQQQPQQQQKQPPPPSAQQKQPQRLGPPTSLKKQQRLGLQLPQQKQKQSPQQQMQSPQPLPDVQQQQPQPLPVVQHQQPQPQQEAPLQQEQQATLQQQGAPLAQQQPQQQQQHQQPQQQQQLGRDGSADAIHSQQPATSSGEQVPGSRQLSDQQLASTLSNKLLASILPSIDKLPSQEEKVAVLKAMQVSVLEALKELQQQPLDVQQPQRDVQQQQRDVQQPHNLQPLGVQQPQDTATKLGVAASLAPDSLAADSAAADSAAAAADSAPSSSASSSSASSSSASSSSASSSSASSGSSGSSDASPSSSSNGSGIDSSDSGSSGSLSGHEALTLGAPITSNSAMGDSNSNSGSAGDSSSSSSGGAGDSSSSSSIDALDPEEVEKAVASGLQSLSRQDLCWEAAHLPALGDPLSKKDKVLSDRMCEKLLASGFTNKLQVANYTPTIAEYVSCIPVSTAAAPKSSGSGLDSSGSSGSSVDGQVTDSELQAAEAGTESADEAAAGEDLRVNFKARCVAVSDPLMARNKPGAMWSALFEAPTDQAGVFTGLQVSFFQPGYNSFAAKKLALEEHRKAVAAMQAGVPIGVKARIKAADTDSARWKPTWKPQDSSQPLVAVTHEATSSPAPLVEWEGGSSSGSSGSGSSGSNDGSSDGSTELQPVYRKIKDVLADDWLGKGNSKGIINPLFASLRKEWSDELDFLPKQLRQQYGLSGWLADFEGAHQPSSLEQWDRSCRGLAFRELVLMQVAQVLERYRLITASDAAVASAALSLQLGPGSSSDDEAAAAAAAPAKRRGAKGSQTLAAASSGGGSGSWGAGALQGQSGDVDSSSDSEDQPLPEHASSSSGSSKFGREPASRSSRQLVDVAGGYRSQAFGIKEAAAVQEALKALEFQLTADQHKALQQVLQDMEGPWAMLRLLQGDVGCGKTVVALIACIAAAAAGHQALLFAPTELLATQHYNTLLQLAEQLPLEFRPRVGQLKGRDTEAVKRQLKRDIADGDKSIIISTQAALWVKQWYSLALVVVDEQHKVGVKQRERLTRGLSAPPHMLLMTATPIPRTLAILQYGGITLSSIKQLPPGRTPVKTRVVHDDDVGRHEVYEAIKQELATGGRAYIVCPLVSENDELEGVRTVEEEFGRLSSSGIFGDVSSCGMLHGKMSAEDKEAALRRFKSGETPVLIASTVVEVGVDVPEASIMLVEGAHRFGLAQLHQLRGRVGRGSKASSCFLMAPPLDSDKAAQATERLQVLERSHNGLDIAEADLKIRGFGDLWSGTKQSGKSSQLSAVTMAQLDKDPSIILQARNVAATLLHSIGSNNALKGALLAYGIMELPQGQKLPVARYGISGM